MTPVFFFWMATILFILFGLFTRFAAIINYVLTVVVVGTITSYEYHMFYSYLITNFLLIFLPASRTLSLDRLLVKLKYSNTRFRYNPPTTVSALSYQVPVFLGVGLVYFDSLFFKYTSPLWMNGLGLWLPSSMPQAVLLDVSPLLNFKYLALGLGYLTLAFETIFLFVFWRKKWRLPLLIIGLGLHFGILICYPIPFFALGVSAMYLLMVPVSWWQKVFKRKSHSTNTIKFYYDGECPLCNRTRVALNHFDSSNRIQFLTVQENAASEPALKNIAEETLLTDIHSVDNNGRVRKGLDTYISVLNAIWYLKPLSWFLRVPGIYHLGKKIYKHVAINRNTERCTEANCGYVVPNLPTGDDKFKILSNLTLRDLKFKGVTIGLAFFVLLQFFTTFNSPLLKITRQKLGIGTKPVVRISEKIAYEIEDFSKIFFGITHHGVFMDRHFNGYNHSIAVVYKAPDGKERWLPIFDKNGTPGNYIFGPLWVKWTFRVNGPTIDQEKLAIGIRDFTAFWAHQNNVSLANAVFAIKVKKNREPKVWEYDFLKKELSNPWLDGGTVIWEDEVFKSAVREIEQM
jgi:predicted DCC family thiol-disulfide oxidoreductase YuxK